MITVDDRQYKIVRFDRVRLPDGQSELEGVEQLLNANAGIGWDLQLFHDSADGQFRDFYFRRPRAT